MLKYILSLGLCFLSMPLFAEQFVAGQDYVVINIAENASHSAKPTTVTEFFSYGCPWCYRLELSLNQWVKKQKGNISFNKVPVVFNKDWEYYAKAYFVAEVLGKNAQLNPTLFKAILTDKRQLNNEQAMINFLTSQGIKTEVVESAFSHSPTIDIRMNYAKQQMAFYQINAVPAFIINNQFKTDLQMAKHEKRLIAILDFLVKKNTTSATNG
ncbi:MAG: thiol:disulfide interchange protein DsbA/DsbL [Legionella sp.]